MTLVTRAIAAVCLLVALMGASNAADRQFSCQGQMIDPSGEQKAPVEISFTLGDKSQMGLKTSGDKPLASRIVSNNKIQLKFATKEFVGEFFHYTGDLFLIYPSGQLARLTCSHT